MSGVPGVGVCSAGSEGVPGGRGSDGSEGGEDGKPGMPCGETGGLGRLVSVGRPEGRPEKEGRLESKGTLGSGKPCRLPCRPLCRPAAPPLARLLRLEREGRLERADRCGGRLSVDATSASAAQGSCRPRILQGETKSAAGVGDGVNWERPDERPEGASASAAGDGSQVPVEHGMEGIQGAAEVRTAAAGCVSVQQRLAVGGGATLGNGGKLDVMPSRRPLAASTLPVPLTARGA